MKLGDKVKWNDPAIEEYKELIEDAENRVFTIKEINGGEDTYIPNELVEDDDMVYISDGVTECECYVRELEMVEEIDYDDYLKLMVSKMQDIELNNEILIGFLDSGEKLNQKQLDKLNIVYKEMFKNATTDEMKDMIENYEGYYPPFVAESLKILDYDKNIHKW